MKKLQQFCAIAILTLALALSAMAGDIGTPGFMDPPPPPHQITGDIGTPGITATGEISAPGVYELDPLTEITLKMLESVLAFF